MADIERDYMKSSYEPVGEPHQKAVILDARGAHLFNLHVQSTDHHDTTLLNFYLPKEACKDGAFNDSVPIITLRVVGFNHSLYLVEGIIDRTALGQQNK